MAEGQSVQHKMVRKEDGPESNSKQFNHPVYKTLSRFNGEVNRMTKEEIQEKLHELGLGTRGVKEVLKKRLKNHFRQQRLGTAKIKQEPREPIYDYYMVIDFEATCEEDNYNFNHEIIEFPVVLVDASSRKVVDEFHAYVKPILHPRLTPFCTELTGITQAQVDSAEPFPVVLQQVENWMAVRQLGTQYSYAVLTDGPWDMGRFMYQQCILSAVKFPRFGRKWCNLRKLYGNFYRCKKPKLIEMLESLGMTFEGSQHSGIDDSRNIARILIHMLQDGAKMKINEKIHERKLQRCSQALGHNMAALNNGRDDETDDAIVDAFDSHDDDNDDYKHAVATRADDTLVNDINRLSLRENDGSGDSTTQCDDLLRYYSLQNRSSKR